MTTASPKNKAKPERFDYEQLEHGGVIGTIWRTTHDNEEDWHEDRKTSCGGSDAATLMGCNHFKSGTLLNMYLAKCSRLPPLEQTEYMKWGHKLESVIAMAYSEEAEVSLEQPGEFTIFRNEATPWMHVTPDFLITGDPRGLGSLQIKNVGTHMAHHWADGIPLSVRVQMQAEMHSTGATWAACAHLVGGQAFSWSEDKRHQDLIDTLIEEGRLFMENVNSEDPEEPDAEERDLPILFQIYPTHKKGLDIAVPDDHQIWTHINGFRKADKEIKLIEGGLGYHKARIIQFIGDAERITLSDGSGFTLKSQIVKEHIVKEFTKRPLRQARKKAKKT